MRKEMYIFLILTVSFIFFNVGLISAQEATTQEPSSVEPDMQWIWGDVVSVDTQKNELLIKYLDYETDSEKEISISVDDKTTLENVKSLDEIKAKDTVSVDYIIVSEGKNLAKNISVEKPESPEVSREEVIPQTTPGDLQPVPTTEETEEKK